MSDDGHLPTISSNADGPPKKRSRPIALESDDADIKVKAEDMDGSWTRDPNYYFLDGNCVLQAERVLFNVHRSILLRESSSFSEILCPPQDQSTVQEGSSDLNPILLSYVTPDQVRNFFWAMYSSPLDITRLPKKQESIPKLVDIAFISNKYRYSSYKTWAFIRLREAVNEYPFDLEHANSESWGHLTAILHLAKRRRHAGLINALVKRLLPHAEFSIRDSLYRLLYICNEIEDADLPGVKMSDKQLPIASAYYAAVLSGPTFWNPTFWNNPQEELSPSTKRRILAGDYKLTRKWASIESDFAFLLPDTVPSGSMPRHAKCNSSWKVFWAETIWSNSVSALDLADCQARLQAVINLFDSWSKKDICKECRKTAHILLSIHLGTFQKNLIDYFPRE